MEEKPVKTDSQEKIIEIDEINENLIKKNKEKRSRPSSTSCLKTVLYAVFPYFKKVNTIDRKTVYIKDDDMNVTEWSNKIENQKYNLITFIPVVLYNQFKQFGNLFYLIMSITQFFDDLKVGFLFTYVSPLAIVVTISMLKELYDDINRRIQDKKTNSTLITVLKENKINNHLEINQKKAADLLVGDIIELKKDTRVPADIIVLKTFNESNDNQAFIRTDQLDGETDWKLRKAPESTQKMSQLEIVKCNGKLECEPPSKLIYNFEGTLTINNNIKEPLNLENTIWASTVIASQGVIGIVIYTGKESRARMNSSTPKLKIGILDIELNKSNVYLFFIMLILSLILTFLKGINFSGSTFFNFIKFMILFCAIIPIALRVNLDVSKTWFSYVIDRDESIPETIARNSTIPEELGRISYVFSDKTGTLTKNEMIFKKIEMCNESFGENNFDDLKEILKEECSKCDAPLLDVYNLLKNENEEPNENQVENLSESNNSEINTNKPLETKKRKKIRRLRNRIIRDTITAMLLCNNVTPIIDDVDNEKITYQASSPDEIALVKFAETLNMKLIYRTDKLLKIKDASGVIEEFEVLANFPFSSETKRMGIILKNIKYGHIIFYLKGAENVMREYAKEEYIGYINENAENLATKGLRTLVITHKLLDEEEFNKWNIEYKEASTSMENRKERMAKVISKLENNMEFLCVTGVEDLLQNDVAITIDNLRNAGMKIWMLTEDKIETATCISISAGIKGKNQKIFTLKYDDIASDDKNESISNLRTQFIEYNKKNSVESHIFIIDGELLDLALKNCEEEFFQTTKNAPSVVCCRCSPTQKRIVVKSIKKYINARTAAVGDGGNDVAMIQEADVGIGIVGKEGLQASLASDYSIKEFRSLNILLLWWGRLAYKNTSILSNFVIHKGLIISINQFIFSMMFYYNAVALYNGMLSLGYSTIFTCTPAISILLDQDIDKDNVLKFPSLYKVLLKGRELNLKNFLWWLFKSIVQSAILMFGAMLLFREHLFLKIVTVSYTALIYLELLNVYMEINKCHRFMWVALISTCLIYTLSLLIFPNVLDIYYIFHLDTFWRIILISLIAWAPFYIINRLKKYFFPQEIEKLKSNK